MLHAISKTGVEQALFNLIAKNQKVIQALGAPVTKDRFSFSFSYTPKTSISMTYSISGAKQGASVTVHAKDQHKKWVMTYLAVMPDNGDALVLINTP